jgi:hypothetical protein
MKLKLRQTPSDSDDRRRYLWPRGAIRTSRVVAPRSYFLLYVVVLMRRIFDLDTTTHPDGGPSGEKSSASPPAVVARDPDRAAVETKDVVDFLFPHLGSFL